MFRSYHLFLLAMLSFNAYASHPLCEPAIANNDVTERQAPSADELKKAMDSALQSATQNLDWVDDKTSGSLCGGYYQAPTSPSLEANTPPDEAGIALSANSVAQSDAGFISLSGNVQAYQGSRRFSCDQLRYNQQQQYSELEGNIMVREQGMLLLADKATIDGQAQNSRFENSQYLLPEQQIRGTAKVFTAENNHSESDRKSNGEQSLIKLEDASFTICPPKDNTWEFSAGKLKLDTLKGWGSAHNMVLRVKDVPVLYIPYFTFPLDDRRKSGFLWPTINGGSGGFDLSLPYYFNIAPNVDATYEARYAADHGYIHGLEGRYKNTWSDWLIGGNYINDDKSINGNSTAGVEDKRWLGVINHAGKLGKGWSTSINYKAVSDVDYLRDLGSTGLDVQKTLNLRRQAAINFSQGNWFIGTEVVDFQRLETGNVSDDYQLLPRTTLRYQPLQKPFHARLNSYVQYSRFSHETLPEAQRLYQRSALSYPMIKPAFSLTPTLSLRSINYQYDSSNRSRASNQQGNLLLGNESLFVPSFSLDQKLFFERSFTHKDSQLKQSLTPRLRYYYSQQKDQDTLINFDTDENSFSYQQVFRDERFSGLDRISDANQLSLGFDTAIQNSETGFESLRFGIGQIFYFDDRETSISQQERQQLSINASDSPAVAKQKRAFNRAVNKRFFRNSSDIASELTWNINQHHGIYSDLNYDPYQNNISSYGIAYHYESSAKHIVNMGYRFKRSTPTLINQQLIDQDSEQVMLSFYSPIHSRWGLFGHSQYDLNHKQAVENLVGVKYESCCWNIAFAWQQERENFSDGQRLSDNNNADYEQNWYIQFEFKGLGGLSTQLSSLLKQSIEGFTP